MSDGGKGSKPRPFSVSRKTFESNWNAIFKKDKTNQIKENKISCGCGRSPTGFCVGWHSLNEKEYQKRLLEYKEKDK